MQTLQSMNELIAYRLQVEEQLPTSLKVVAIRKFPFIYVSRSKVPAADPDYQVTANYTYEPTSYLNVL
jgi:hypothetical protein